MKSVLEAIIGVQLLRIIPHDHNDGWTLQFSNQSVIAIFNDVNFEKIEPDTNKEYGYLVADVSETNDAIRIAFTNGSSITIHLHPEHWHEPEALVFTKENGEIVVWN